MQPLIALLACLGLILILFRLDRPDKSLVSSALWIPTLWLLIIGSRMVSLWFDVGAAQATEGAYAEGSPMDRNIFLALIVAALVIVIARGVRLSQVVKANHWMFLFLLYCAVSIAWSDFPDVSIKRYVKEIGNLLMVLIVLSERDPGEALITVFKRCAYILIPLSVVMIKFYPAFGRTYGRWSGHLSYTGVTNNKNSLGVLCAVCGIILFWKLVSIWQRKRNLGNKMLFLVPAFMLVMTIWVLNLSNSATSMACFVIAIGIITVIEVKAVRNSILFALPAILLLGGYIMMSDSLLGAFTGVVERDATLTGRTEVWQKVLEMVENPLIGGGYNSFFLGDRLTSLWSEYTWRLTEAHNGYIEIYLDLGIIGLSLLVALIIVSLRAALTGVRSDIETGSLKLAMLVSAIAYNITESAFRPGLLMYFVFVLVVIQMPRPVQIQPHGIHRSIPA